MFVHAQPQELGANQRPALQVKNELALLLDPFSNFAVAGGLHGSKFHTEGRPYELHWLFADLPESGSQRLMPAHDLVDALLQSGNAEFTFDLDWQMDVIQVAFRIELLQEP